MRVCLLILLLLPAHLVSQPSFEKSYSNTRVTKESLSNISYLSEETLVDGEWINHGRQHIRDNGMQEFTECTYIYGELDGYVSTFKINNGLVEENPYSQIYFHQGTAWFVIMVDKDGWSYWGFPLLGVRVKRTYFLILCLGLALGGTLLIIMFRRKRRNPAIGSNK